MSAKNNSKPNNNSSNDIYGDMGKMLVYGFLAFVAWIVIFALTLSATIAVMAEKLREQGLTEWEIFKAKSCICFNHCFFCGRLYSTKYYD